MTKDKDKGKETKPSSETRDVVKIQDDVVKAKDVLALQLSKEGDRVRFLVQQSLGPTLIAEHPVIRRKGAPQAIPPLLLFIAGTIHACSIAARIRLWIYHSASSSFSSSVPSMLAQLLLEQDCESTIPPLLLSHRRYHPCLLNCC